MATYDYSRLQAQFNRNIERFGSALTLRGAPVSSDPVTGLGGSDGPERTVRGVVTRVDFKVFPESLVRDGDLMAVLQPSANPIIGERWVKSASEEFTIVQTIEETPDNSTTIAWQVLLRG